MKTMKTMMRWIRSGVLGLGLITTIACDGSTFSNGSPTAPTPSLNLAGTWTGTLAIDGESNPPRVTWTASHNGNSVTGPMVVTFTDTDSGMVETVRGTLAGTLSGTQLSLTASFPAGTFPQAPSCSITGTGTTTPSSTTISLDITVTFSSGCLGTITDRPTETDRLTLTKQ